MEDTLIDYLSTFITSDRLQLFERNLKFRTRYLTILLEDIYQRQNASAVLRTADCFGIQDVHVVENRNRFSVDPEVAMGASKWLSIHHYRKSGSSENTLDAIKRLKRDGYRIIATSPHDSMTDTLLEDFDLGKGKAAIVFGTELKGISPQVREQADEFMRIPMYGFTESFNISVSAAIVLHYLSHQLRHVSSVDWRLNGQDRNQIMLEWLRKSIKSSDLIEKAFWESKQQDKQ